ncbi:MAG: sulfite exporter TauE/SafE family protein [Campylobacterota bacterium]|nr:sulfite exporter TauE/SafE family protein [Campylobacterota bacterium]
MEILLAVIGLGIGALSGFFGIGGGTVLVPVLLLMGMEMKAAVGISIMQMVFSSIFGSYLNHRKGSLELGEGLYVGLGGFVGGYLSGYLTAHIPDTVLQYTFILFVLFALYRLLLAPEPHEDAESRALPKWLLFVIGIGIGIIAISIGVGGAIILIPLLSGFLHYPIKKAVSAGLFFVVFSSVAGFLGRLMHGEIDLVNGLIIGVASLFGVYFGIWLKDKIHAKKHKNFIVGMYLFILGIMIYEMFFSQQG